MITSSKTKTKSAQEAQSSVLPTNRQGTTKGMLPCSPNSTSLHWIILYRLLDVEQRSRWCLRQTPFDTPFGLPLLFLRDVTLGHVRFVRRLIWTTSDGHSSTDLCRYEPLSTAGTLKSLTRVSRAPFEFPMRSSSNFMTPGSNRRMMVLPPE